MGNESSYPSWSSFHSISKSHCSRDKGEQQRISGEVLAGTSPPAKLKYRQRQTGLVHPSAEIEVFRAREYFAVRIKRPMVWENGGSLGYQEAAIIVISRQRVSISWYAYIRACQSPAVAGGLSGRNRQQSRQAWTPPPATRPWCFTFRWQDGSTSSPRWPASWKEQGAATLLPAANDPIMPPCLAMSHDT